MVISFSIHGIIDGATPVVLLSRALMPFLPVSSSGLQDEHETTN